MDVHWLVWFVVGSMGAFAVVLGAVTWLTHDR